MADAIWSQSRRLDARRASLLDFGLPQRNSGGIALSREGKKDQPQRLLSCPPSRREFLAWCGQGAGAALVPERWFGALHPEESPLPTDAISAGRFHLHPH